MGDYNLHNYPWGIVAGLFELFRNRITIKRQEYLETSKIKIESLSKSIVYYWGMSHWGQLLGLELENEDRDTQLCFYFVCKYLHIRRKWRMEIGQWQLDNIIAESVLAELNEHLFAKVMLNLGFAALDRMINLIDYKTSYEDFLVILRGNQQLFDQFDSFLNSLSPEEIENIVNAAFWFSTLLDLEIYHTYRIWYNEYPYIDDVIGNTALLNFLKNRFPAYYKRIMSFNKTKWLRKRRYVNEEYEGLS